MPVEGLTTDDFEQLEADLQRQIDELCDRYESALNRGNVASIENYLTTIDNDAARGILFAETGDFNGNDETGFEDFLILAENFGATRPKN